MNSVPNDEIKVWQITRTSTSLVVVCNGVTVLNFNFHTDYADGYSGCYELWGKSTAIQFYYSGEMYGDTSHLFMRIAREGKFDLKFFESLSAKECYGKKMSNCKHCLTSVAEKVYQNQIVLERPNN